MVAEVKNSVIPLQRVCFRLTLTLYDKDANLACLAQIRQRLGERARRIWRGLRSHRGYVGRRCRIAANADGFPR